MRRADSRAACTAGSSNATSTPMMAMTTSNSTSVNARGLCLGEVKRMGDPSTHHEAALRGASQADFVSAFEVAPDVSTWRKALGFFGGSGLHGAIPDRVRGR